MVYSGAECMPHTKKSEVKINHPNPPSNYFSLNLSFKNLIQYLNMTTIPINQPIKKIATDSCLYPASLKKSKENIQTTQTNSENECILSFTRL